MAACSTKSSVSSLVALRRVRPSLSFCTRLFIVSLALTAGTSSYYYAQAALTPEAKQGQELAGGSTSPMSQSYFEPAELEKDLIQTPLKEAAAFLEATDGGEKAAASADPASADPASDTKLKLSLKPLADMGKKGYAALMKNPAAASAGLGGLFLMTRTFLASHPLFLFAVLTGASVFGARALVDKYDLNDKQLSAIAAGITILMLGFATFGRSSPPPTKTELMGKVAGNIRHSVKDIGHQLANAGRIMFNKPTVE